METTKLMMALAACALAIGSNLQAYEISSGLSTEQLAQYSSQADVFVETWDVSGKLIGTGSGFFYTHNSDEAYIITNAHVLKGASSVRLTAKNGVTALYRGLHAYNAERDIAAIVFDTSFSFGYTHNPLSRAMTRSIGQRIWVGGHPEGFPFTFTEGMISALWPQGIQISAPISPGSSGSAVINEKGEVLGVASQIYRESQNLNYAISIDVVEQVIEEKDSSVPLIVDHLEWKQPESQHNELAQTQPGLIKPVNLGETYTAKDGTHYAEVLDTDAFDAISQPLRTHLENRGFKPSLFLTRLLQYYDLKDCTLKQAAALDENYNKHWPIQTSSVNGKGKVWEMWFDGQGQNGETYFVVLPFHWTASNSKRTLSGDKVACAIVTPNVHCDTKEPAYFIAALWNK